MVIELPYPPSVNHYYRRVGPRTLISREGRAFRMNVCALLCGNGPRRPPAGGRIALCMDAFPPDRRRRDLDNAIKSSLDSLQHAGVYEDDGQIDLLLARRRAPVKGGKAIVHIGELPLVRCPLCGRELPAGHRYFDSFHLLRAHWLRPGEGRRLVAGAVN